MKNVRDVRQAFGKPGKVRLLMDSGGVNGIQVGNEVLSQKEANKFFMGQYGTIPKSPSSYYDFIKTTQRLGETGTKYNVKRYVV